MNCIGRFRRPILFSPILKSPVQRRIAMDEKLEKRNQLALDVLRLSRNTLLVNLRFLDAALNQLEPLQVDGLTLATDGEALAYDPAHVLRLYRDERESVTRAYLHMVLHGVFRHMFVHTLVDHHVWDLACDTFSLPCFLFGCLNSANPCANLH